MLACKKVKSEAEVLDITKLGATKGGDISEVRRIY